MEYDVIVSESAEQDIDEILTYMTEKLANPKAAADWADELQARYDELSSYPLIYGQATSESLKRMGYRRFVIKNYVAFYRVDDARGEVVILRVFYGRRDYEKYL